MKILYPILAIAVLGYCHASWSQEEVYKTVDETGKVTFSDTPDKESEKIDVTPQNILEATGREESSLPRKKKEKKPANYKIRLVSPTQGQQIGPTYKSLPVNVTLNRNLLKGHALVYYLNGEVYRGPTNATRISIPLSIKMRGQNTLSVNVVDENNTRLSSSNSVTVYVIRPR